MKLRNKINLLHLSLLFLSCSLTAEQFSLLTWNICGPNAPDAKQLFPDKPAEQRMKHVADLIFEDNINILCLQEVSEDLSSQFITKALEAARHYRRAAFCNKGQYGGAVIFYNEDVFNCQHYYCFRLNDPAATRDLSGNMLPNKGGGSAACAVLQFKKSGKQIVVCSVHLTRGNNRGNQDDFNTNLPFTNEEKGRFQLEILFDQLFKFLNSKKIDILKIPLVFAGDFNTFAEEMESLVMGYDFIKDLSLAIMPSLFFTVYHFDRNHPDRPLWAAIDHILYSRSLHLIKRCPLPYDEEDRNINRYKNFTARARLRPDYRDQFPSDHRPIIVEFETDTTQKQSNNRNELEDPELTKALEESLSIAQPAPTPTRHQAKNKPAHLFNEFWDKLGKEPKDFTEHEWDLFAEYNRNWDLEHNQRQPAPAPAPAIRKHNDPDPAMYARRHIQGRLKTGPALPAVHAQRHIQGKLQTNPALPDEDNPLYKEWLHVIDTKNKFIPFHDWLQSKNA
jgi:endonuclease/exonuclease/phosphatase family metal-dependent hydrolase